VELFPGPPNTSGRSNMRGSRMFFAALALSLGFRDGRRGGPRRRATAGPTARGARSRQWRCCSAGHGSVTHAYLLLLTVSALTVSALCRLVRALFARETDGGRLCFLAATCWPCLSAGARSEHPAGAHRRSRYRCVCQRLPAQERFDMLTGRTSRWLTASALGYVGQIQNTG
jgi:hypothetical protein